MKAMNILVATIGLAFFACSFDDDTADIITVNCSPDRGAFTADGGTLGFAVSSSRGEWTAYSNDAWINVQISSALDSVYVIAEANKTTEMREGQMVIKSGTERKYVPITQAAAVAISCTPSSALLSADGETVEFNVTITPEAQWSVETDADWLTYTTTSNSITLTAKANDTSIMRTASVVVKSGQMSTIIAISQKGNGEIKPSVNVSDDYSLIWHDEFDGVSLSSDWTYEIWDKGRVNNELQYYRKAEIDGKKTVEVSNDVLNINCFMGADGNVYSGRINAKVNEGWQYGYIEARIKLPKGKGTWPAFWMMPVNVDWANEGWPKCGEIDIMEEVGANPNYVSSSLHAEGHVHTLGNQVTHEMLCEGAEDDFHVYAMEWTKEGITTYVDGKLQLSYKSDGTVKNYPYDKPYYIILNLAWGGDWGGYKGIDESALPTTMQVDYVRVFQKK